MRPVAVTSCFVLPVITMPRTGDAGPLVRKTQSVRADVARRQAQKLGIPLQLNGQPRL